jgi:hypothetical protein
LHLNTSKQSRKSASKDELRIIEYITNFGGAVKLDFNNCGMDDTDAKVLAELLRDNTIVQHLLVQKNDLKAAGANYIADMLKVNKTLTLLDLSENGIEAKGAAALIDGLKVNTACQHLFVQNNDLRAAGAQAFGNMLKENRTLVELDLSDNGIGYFLKPTPEGPAALAEALRVNRQLHHLDLSDNGIGIDQVKVDLHQVFCLVTCRDRCLEEEEFNHCILDFPQKQRAFANQRKYLSYVREESEIVEDAITKRKLRIQDQVQAINLSHSDSGAGSLNWSKVQDVKQIASTIADGFNREY